MKIMHGMTQGDAAWLAHRASVKNASDAPAMMGASSYVSRIEIVRQYATGISSEIDANTQRIFDRGHEVEPALRALAESLIGEELFPAIGVSDDGELGASFDGVTMDECTIFEAKQSNAEKERIAQTGEIPPQDYWQVVHQFAVCDSAKRCIYIVGDGTEAGSSWAIVGRQAIEADIPKLRAGWAQFDADVAAYQERPQEAPAPAGRTLDQLPALHIAVTGMVTASNLNEVRDHAIAVFQSINTDLQTDQDFADAEKAVKWCADIESRLDAAKEHALSQTASIDELFRALDSVKAEARSKRLELDKLVKARKEAIRTEIAYAGRDAIQAHYDAVNATMGEHRLSVPGTIGADLNAAINGKRTVTSLRDAVDTVVTQHKIAASQKADQVRACVAVLKEAAAGHETLFADRVALCATKAPDDLRNLIAARIAEHEAKEKARLESEREKIRAEEAARIEAERKATEAKPEAGNVQAAASAATHAEPAAAGTARVVEAGGAPLRSGLRTPVKTRPTDAEIIEVLSLRYRVHESKVVEWLLAMDLDAASRALVA